MELLLKPYWVDTLYQYLIIVVCLQIEAHLLESEVNPVH